MVELEYDKTKKLCVVGLLYLLSLSVIAYMYYSKTELDLESIILEFIKTP